MIRWIALASVVACFAHAQQPQGPLQRAEAAYLEVDFDGTRNFALQALRAGGHSPQQLVRIYQLLGISSAATNHNDEARDYFVRMLGLDANAQLDSSVPPRLRDGYLEARGIVAARSGQLGVQANLDRAASALRIQLTDTTDMARRVRVHARIEGVAAYGTTDAVARATTIDAFVPGANTADRIEYWIEVLDQFGNQLVLEGNQIEPRVVGRTEIATPVAPVTGGGTTIFEEPWFWTVAGGVLAVAAAVIITAIVVDQRSRIGATTSITIGLP
jgi:hypothetical protein